MAIENKGNAQWNGGLKDGDGTISTGTGAVSNQPYTFASRFEHGKGTNPEELIAAAHAGCYSMALSAELEKAGHKGDNVKTAATLTLDFINGAPTVTTIKLVTEATVPGIDADKFAEIAKGAKENCPISRLLKAADITLDAKLV